MPVSDAEILSNVQKWMTLYNEGKLDELWTILADPESFVLIDALYDQECRKALKFCTDEIGAKMTLSPGYESKITRNMFPGIHQVETHVDFKFAKPVFEGTPTVPGFEVAAKAIQECVDGMKMRDAEVFGAMITDNGILIDPVGVYRGPAASTKAMAGWIGAGLSGATIVMGPYPLLPYRAAALVDYDFSLLSDDAPLTKHTVGMLMVDADPESGKIKRCVAVAHENANRKWNSDVVNWLIEKQKQAAKTGPAA